jgi:hypothetical protein
LEGKGIVKKKKKKRNIMYMGCPKKKMREGKEMEAQCSKGMLEGSMS